VNYVLVLKKEREWSFAVITMATVAEGEAAAAVADPGEEKR